MGTKAKMKINRVNILNQAILKKYCKKLVYVVAKQKIKVMKNYFKIYLLK